ncbi:MAG: rod shape-determining protein MreC [Flavobacteriales bacterium]
MKNLFALLYKNHLFLLFLFLEITALFFAIQYNAFQRSSFISSSSSISGNTYQAIDNFSGYLDLREKNELLADSLAKLKGETLSAIMLRDSNFTKVHDTLYKQLYTYVPARVIHMTMRRANNYLTLNKGSDDGIKENMAVVGVNGIVGVVNGVTPSYSSVMSILHSKTELSCRLKSTNNVGFLKWNSADYNYRTALLKDVPLTAKVTKGDTVITAEYSNSFPGGIPVGKVLTARLAEEGQSQDVDIELFLDFNVLDHVFIVRDLMKEQKDSLQNKFQHD